MGQLGDFDTRKIGKIYEAISSKICYLYRNYDCFYDCYGICLSTYKSGRNETEPFLAVNQNIQYTDFRALLRSGELIYRSDDIYERYILPDMTEIAVLGQTIAGMKENGSCLFLDVEEY